jgi:hypothetical protein
VLLVAVALYWGLVPLLWPRPSVAVTVPASTALDGAPTVRVVVSAWHANVRVLHVRCYPDPHRSTAQGPRGLFPPVVLHRDPAALVWPYWSLSRRTWPQRVEIARVLPLRELAREDTAGRPK